MGGGGAEPPPPMPLPSSAEPKPPTPPDAGAERATMLGAVDLARSFGETRALRHCSVELRAGEVHAIVGENGSGKSTFVKILAGVLSPDSGVLRLGGRELRRIASPRQARRLGIATVFQEVLVVEALSVLDNIWLGADGPFRHVVPAVQKRAGARQALELLSDRSIDLDTPLERLELSDRQIVVIARALVQEPRVLILDESTSALDVSTRDRLFETVRRRCDEGTAVVFISHRMDEIEQIADRVTVLRSGESVGTLERAEASPERLLQLMSSRRLTDASERRARSGSPRVVLRLAQVVLERGHEPIDTDVRAGEIVGVAGLEGHGQERFLRILAGVDVPIGGEVVRYDNGEPHRVRSHADAARRGIAYVPRDRKTEGTFEPLSILDNFSLPTLARDARGGFVLDRSRLRRLHEYVDALRITYGSPRHRITTLSGGNQQKVIIARWLATKPAVMVLNDPTRGVDLGTKQDIYRLLDELARSGVAVVMLSTEIEEHLALMDRILVFREGRVFTELDAETLTREGLVGAFFGRRAAATAQ